MAAWRNRRRSAAAAKHRGGNGVIIKRVFSDVAAASAKIGK